MAAPMRVLLTAAVVLSNLSAAGAQEPGFQELVQKWHAAHDQQAFAQAETVGRELLAYSQRFLTDSPRHHALSWEMLGIAYGRQGKHAEALKAFQQCLANREQYLAANDINMAHALHNLAVTHRELEQLPQAVKFYERANRTLALHEEERELLVIWTIALAEIQGEREQLSDAETSYQQAARLLKQLGVDDTSDPASVERARQLAELHMALGYLLYQHERYDKAVENFRICAQAYEALGEPDTPDNCLYHLVLSLNELGRYEEARDLGRRVIRIQENKLGAESIDLGWSLGSLGDTLYMLEEYAEARKLYQRSLDIKMQHLDETDPLLATHLEVMAELVGDVLQESEDAEQLYRRALAIREKGDDPLAVSDVLYNLGYLLHSTERPAEARKLFQRSLDLRAAELGEDSEAVAWCRVMLGSVQHDLGKYDESEVLLRQGLEVLSREYGDESLEVAEVLLSLVATLHWKARYAEAQELAERSLAIHTKVLGDEDPEVAWCLTQLASLTLALESDSLKAERLIQRALAILEAAHGPDYAELASPLWMLGDLYYMQDRYAEAESIFRRALKLRETALGRDHTLTAESQIGLANVLTAQGRFAAAEPLYTQALATLTERLGNRHPQLSPPLLRFSDFYVFQRRYDEAQVLLDQALANTRAALGAKHIDVTYALNRLAEVHRQQGNLDEAESMFRESLAITRDKFGEDHAELGWDLLGIAEVAKARKDFETAEKTLQQVVALWDEQDGLGVAIALETLAEVYADQERFAEAEPLVDRVVTLRDRLSAAPSDRLDAYSLRARLNWSVDRKREAIADLRKAMDLAEQQRVHISGTERERARAFAAYANVFEQMVRWQTTLGDTNEALAAMERARARSLLDEFALASVDLEAGQSATQRNQNQQREAQLKRKIADLTRQFEKIAETNADDQEKQRQREALHAQLAEGRADLYDHFRTQRTRSQVYLKLLAADQGPPRVSQVQRTLVAPGTLILNYLVGEEGGYLLWISHDATGLVALEADGATADLLAVDAGSWNAARLHRALIGEDRPGVLSGLKEPRLSQQTTRQLEALYKSVLPPDVRERLVRGDVKRLIVVPDGPLALLPFEALVVAIGNRPQFLLDLDIPVHYAPSLAILYSLAEQRKKAADGQPPSILSVGDPQYQPADAPSDDPNSESGTRYAFLGGSLKPLPYSGIESQWVSEAFSRSGMQTTTLTGAQATETNLRKALANRQVIHLACHGFADQKFGNFFGALAFTPERLASAPSDQPSDGDEASDGFLTLAEIYGLKLQGAEITILSACDTNIGPQQRGEGMWAISRGFLVAGSRRVVASNWLVDDQAAASLVGYFCNQLAQQQAQQQELDYPQALHDAKRWIRQQQAWESPYYWSTFVLVGPR